MTFDIIRLQAAVREDEQRDRWTLAFTGVCPRCKNAKGERFVDRETGEIEWIWCSFCHSEAELEAKAEA